MCEIITGKITKKEEEYRQACKKKYYPIL